jgi:ABC-type multidrug transport system fused ATPase/permease subunit
MHRNAAFSTDDITVRSAISIVPQSPDLFEGTMRENVDPTGAYQDEEIWTGAVPFASVPSAQH